MTVLQSQNVNDVIDHLAAKLSVPAAHLWAVLVAQVRVEVIQNAIAIAIFGAAIAWFLIARKRLEQWVEDGGEYSDRGFFFGGLHIIAALSAIITCGCIGSLIGKVLNPEFYALQNILSALK